MSRMPARVVPRNAKPLPRQATNGSTAPTPTANEPAEDRFVYLAALDAFMCGEANLLGAECIAVLVEVGSDGYEPEKSHASIADIPAHAIRGQSKPLAGKRVENAAFYVESFRVDVPEGGALQRARARGRGPARLFPAVGGRHRFGGSYPFLSDGGPVFNFV